MGFIVLAAASALSGLVGYLFGDSNAAEREESLARKYSDAVAREELARMAADELVAEVERLKAEVERLRQRRGADESPTEDEAILTKVINEVQLMLLPAQG